ncbi:MAG: MBL fold metallo-hydrolase [Candidatus Latescibacterota bacterium]|jgi:glyoxylase-like metal-dependent hydrolase (beta-lactamase superfamily II)
MPARDSWIHLGPDLFLWPDACNVYLLRDGERALAIDYGTGAWRRHLDRIQVRRVEQVVLTHTHRDQLCGLYREPDPTLTVHLPAGDAALVGAEEVEHFWVVYQTNGCPASYAAPRGPVPHARADLTADTETRIGPVRLCAIATPGHTQGALSYLVEWRGRHLAFCGDAVHAGGTIHQPYHLEWDHWTPSGCLAAWHGLERLGYCGFDALLPSHGPPILERPRSCLSQVQRRLLQLIRAKGSVCAGEPNRWVDLEPTSCGAWRVLPHLYQFGANSFLLVSRAGEGLVVDPQLVDLSRLEPLMQELGLSRISVGTASHYHLDHSDGLGQLRDRYGACSWVHPWVAEPILDRNRYDLPWLPTASVPVDRLLPENGPFRWQEYRFRSHAFPGQTRWHTAFDGEIDGCRVLFSGDNYQPPSRWNGTGGFCAYNGSRFSEGFGRSAALVLELAPDLICNGHGCVYRFAPSHYRRIVRWSQTAEAAVRELCPSTDWLADYDCRAARWEPFVTKARAGRAFDLHLCLTNHARREMRAIACPVGPDGWSLEPASRCLRLPAGNERRIRFRVTVPRRTEPGRYLLAADLQIDDHLDAEACVALVDVG